MNTNIHNWLNTILIVIVGALVLVGGNQNLGGGTRFPNGLSTDSTSPSAGQVRTTTLTVTGASTLTGAVTASGLVTADAGTLRSYTNATSTTATTQTLTQSDFLNYDTILLTPNVGALTATLPATSTVTTMIPTAGDMQETCIYNATSTAAATITLAAGAGMDLERVATSTTSGSAGVLAIPAGGSACLKFVRQTSTDINVVMTSYLDAD